MIKNMSASFADSTPSTQASAARGRQRNLNKGSGRIYIPELFPTDDDRRILKGKSRLFAPNSKQKVILELMAEAITGSAGMRPAVITIGQILRKMGVRKYHSAHGLLREVNSGLRSEDLCLMTFGKGQSLEETEIALHRIPQHFVKA